MSARDSATNIFRVAVQNYTPVDAVLTWHGLVATQQLVALLEVGFWPQWHTILRHWLSGAPDHDEVARWYLTWKSRFPQVVPPLLLHLHRFPHNPLGYYPHSYDLAHLPRNRFVCSIICMRLADGN